MSDLIVVTGYGQFAGHEVNASGEAVKILPNEVKVAEKSYEIRTFEVSVDYDDVDKKVEEIWQLKPFLVVHCGEIDEIYRRNHTLSLVFKVFMVLQTE